MMMSFARPRPTSRASRWVPPEPGIIPIVASGSAICTSSAAIRKSQASASSRPTPKTYPWRLAITGFEQRSGAATFFASCETTQGERVRNPAMSPPAVNWPPAPVSTTKRTASSRSSSAKSAESWSRASIETRLNFPGTSSVIVATPRSPSRSTRKPSNSVTPAPSCRIRRAGPCAGSSPMRSSGATGTRRYSRGRLNRASGEARQCASSSSAVTSPTTTATTRCPRRSSGSAHHRHLAHPGVAREHVLDLERMDVLAAGDDHVVDPPVDPEVAVGVEVAGVAGVVPAVANRLLVGVRPVPVAGERLVAREVHADLAVPARASGAC